ncbi:MAG: ribosome assembly RNA-binding protein YhbY [Clostridia bacterium]|nr:ribosome assembly RNA-binding protein YhbY [Clostridia bacterium]
MLTSKQRAYLKNLAQNVQPIFQIGKNEISDNMIKQISDALTARELVKISVLDNSQYTAREAADRIAEATSSDVVIVIGNRFVLYRMTTDKKRYENRIILP